MKEPLHPAVDPEWQARKAADPKLIDRAFDEIAGQMEEADRHTAAPTNEPDAIERVRLERQMYQFLGVLASVLDNILKSQRLEVLKLQHQGRVVSILVGGPGSGMRAFQVIFELSEIDRFIREDAEIEGRRFIDKLVERILAHRNGLAIRDL